MYFTTFYLCRIWFVFVIFLISFIKHLDLVENHISVSESISQRIIWLYTRWFIFSTLDENDKKSTKIGNIWFPSHLLFR